MEVGEGRLEREVKVEALVYRSGGGLGWYEWTVGSHCALGLGILWKSERVKKTPAMADV